jgi:hypothetical protein
MAGVINSLNFIIFQAVFGLSYFVHTCVFDSIFDRAQFTIDLWAVV